MNVDLFFILKSGRKKTKILRSILFDSLAIFKTKFGKNLNWGGAGKKGYKKRIFD